MKNEAKLCWPARVGSVALAVCLQIPPLAYVLLEPCTRCHSYHFDWLPHVDTSQWALSPRQILFIVWGVLLAVAAVLFFAPHGLAGGYAPYKRPVYRSLAAATQLDCALASKLAAYPIFFFFLWNLTSYGTAVFVLLLWIPPIAIGLGVVIFFLLCLLFSGYVLATSLYTINALVHLLLAKKLKVWQGVLAIVLSLLPLSDIVMTVGLRRIASKEGRQDLKTPLIASAICAVVGLIALGVVIILATIPTIDFVQSVFTS